MKDIEAKIDKDLEFYPKTFREHLDGFEWQSDLINT